MDRTARIGTGQDTFRRIVALLFALADLADRAAFAPRPICCLVIWALREAEAVAKEFIIQTACAAGQQWSPADIAPRHGFEPADAEELAMSLRMLALMLRAMAAAVFGPGSAGRDAAFMECSRARPLRQRRHQRVPDLWSAVAASAENCDTS